MTVEFDRFFRETYPSVVRSMVLIVGDGDLARELAQEAMTRALLAWEGLENVEHAQRFAFRVAANLARSRWRRERRTTSRAFIPDAPTSESTDAVEDRIAVGAAVASLSERQRMCFALVEVLGLTPAEVGIALGMRASTVRVHLSRARRRLIVILAPTYLERVEP